MKNSEYEKIEFKGSKEAIIIDLNDEKDFDTISNMIVSKIESSKSFFNGARIFKIESEFLGDDSKEKLKELITSKFNIDFYKP
ncbi:MAG: septum site-determining protein MinC, partial [Peptacetobacter hiranonis]|nr:septum site-determining protein MinC [Peptacetobacter hiranonis]